MDTIRCPQCKKLLRADAQSCNRCGSVIAAGTRTRRRAGTRNGQTLAPSQPTSPLASPHRAGHYSGLHPEDQPFQSSFFLSVQRLPEPASDKADADTFLNAHGAQPLDRQQSLIWPQDEALEPFATANRELADVPTLHPRRTHNTPLPETLLPATSQQSARQKRRIVPVLVTASLLCFLLASGLLTFLLVRDNQAHASKPQLLVLPGELRVGDTLQLSGSGFASHHVLTLTRDTRTTILDAQGTPLRPATDAQGAFQIRVPITATWRIGVHTLQASAGNFVASTSLTIQAALDGPPRLQISASPLDLGAGNPGTLSHENITLTNAGGGQVNWSAQSNVAWLSLNPASGSFAGSAVIALTVNRANLAPQAYLGQIVFTQNGGASQVLHVSMTVNTTSANLALSSASLAFAGTPIQGPAGQTIVIQNSGGQALDWASGTTTTNGANWLSITPASGRLAAHTSAILTVSVNTHNMSLGTYQGALSFSYAGGPAQQVAVTLTISAPPQPVMHLTPQNLSFTAQQSVNPTPESFTILNSGNAPLNWVIHPDATGTNYLSISPVKGSVPPGQSANVSIAPLLGNASGTINSTLSIQDSDPGTALPTQRVNVSVAITSEPILTIVQGNQEFDDPSTPTTSTQLVIFTDTGSLPMHWALVGSAPWLSFDVTSGTVAPGDFGFINVTCAHGTIKPGTYTATLTLKDTDANTIVAPQTITIKLVVSG